MQGNFNLNLKKKTEEEMERCWDLSTIHFTIKRARLDDDEE